MVVGAVPQFRRFIDFCHRYPNDQGRCREAKRMIAEEESHDAPSNKGWMASKTSLRAGAALLIRA